MNRVDHDIRVDEIPKLTVQEAKKAKKLTLPTMAAYMNSRGAISGMQRKGRKKLQGKRGHDQVTREPEEELDSGASECIEVKGPITRRQRTEATVASSPSIGAVARGREGNRRGGRR